MNTIIQIQSSWHRLLLIVLVFSLTASINVIGQKMQVSGLVNNEKGEAMSGVSILIKGTNKGTSTDKDGKFSLEAAKGSNLLFSFIGYSTQSITLGNNTILTITLNEITKSLDEVVVTGVFDKRTALESSIAISTLNSKSISKISANSAADLLSYTPGVYVNSSVGEVGNTVFSRGVNANQFSVAGGNGYYYVALMEDGLPTTNLSSGNIVADFFYRADATLARLESVRGGSASITGNNSPGGIFNYVSNTGQKPVNTIVYKAGLEGNGTNLYNKLDFNLGGKVGGSDWYYNLGGFYRVSDGARNPGYALNKGGQLKLNFIKSLANGGFIKVYAKYLNDKNATPQALPAKNYDNPTLVDGFSNTDTYMLPAATSSHPLWNAKDTYNFDPSNLINSTDITLGTEINLHLKNGWILNNNIKGSYKTVQQNLTILTAPTSLTSLLTYALMGMVSPGTISMNDLKTGQQLVEVKADFSRGPSWSVTKNNLPSQSAMKDGVLFNFTSYSNTKLSELIDQISFNKKVGNHSITLGSYLAFSDISTDPNGTANSSLRAIQSRSIPLDITLTLPNAAKVQITNPQGYAQLSGGGFSFKSFNATMNQLSGYIADGIQATDKLNIDLGLRYDYIGVKGVNNIGKQNADSDKGGLDNNPLTRYDNGYFVKGEDVKYDNQLNLFSYSAGVNYKFNYANSVYARYSNGKKAPDMQFYFDNFNSSAASPEVKAQTVSQFELGYKFKTAKVSGSLIPFYSSLSDIPVSLIAQNADNTSYYTPVVYNQLETFGLEAEANVEITKKFAINANFTLQKSSAKTWQSWVTGNNGSQDDVLVNNNGNTSENVPTLMFNISPTYNFKKGYAMITYRYMGDRQANMANTFTLPGFGQTNLSVGYELSSKLSLTANINNLTDKLGVMNWQATSEKALVDAFGHNSFTPERRAENPNSIFQIIAVQPRSFFLTLSYKL